MKEPIHLSLHELTALLAATEEWLQHVSTNVSLSRLPSALQLICRDVVLPTLVTRLQHDVHTCLTDGRTAECKRLPVAFSLAELLALFYCIPNAGADGALTSGMRLVYQHLHQRLPNLSS